MNHCGTLSEEHAGPSSCVVGACSTVPRHWSLACERPLWGGVRLRHKKQSHRSSCCVLQIFFSPPPSLQGLLPNSGSDYNVVGAKHMGIKKTFSRLGKVGCTFLGFFFQRSALWSTLSPPFLNWIQHTARVFRCQICYSVINFLDRNWASCGQSYCCIILIS